MGSASGGTGAGPPTLEQVLKLEESILSGHGGKLRGFRVVHQSLYLDFDLLHASFSGYAELTVADLQSTQETIRLNMSQGSVLMITIDEEESEFVLHPTWCHAPPTAVHCRDSESFRFRSMEQQVEADKGELEITVPTSVRQKLGSQIQPDNVMLRIYYRIQNPEAGVVFSVPTDEVPETVPQAQTRESWRNARAWMPCVDTLVDKCSWKFVFRTLSEETVVCSGDLDEQVITDDEVYKMSSFSLERSTAPHHIALAISKFEVYPDSQLPFVTHFCLPGRLPKLQHTVNFLPGLFSFYEDFLGEGYPYETFKCVFLEDVYQDCQVGAGMAMFTTHMLVDEKVIDQAMETRREMARAAASVWIGYFVGIKYFADHWIRVGFASYLSDIFVRKAFGFNEFKFRLLKAQEAVWLTDGQEDDFDHPVYYNHLNNLEQLNGGLLPYKASLAMHMIEKKIKTDTFRKVLTKLMTEAQDSTISLSTDRFLKTVKRVSGIDMKDFAEQWIFTSGCPELNCEFSFDRKKNQTVVTIRQSALCTKNKRKIFVGPITIRIAETEGTYDHVVNITEQAHTFDFPCRSKLRKAQGRRNKKGGDEEAERVTGTPVLWVRVDPELEWTRCLRLKQPESMWLNQLEKDRDVSAQYEALRSLCLDPTKVSVDALTAIVRSRRIFYRVRTEAAFALAESALGTEDYTGLTALLQTFKQKYFDDTQTVVAPNNFRMVSEYHVKKGLAQACFIVRDGNQKTPREVSEFILELLKNNDNGENPFSDCVYVSSLLRGVAFISPEDPETDERLFKQIKRYLDYDTLMPCYQNVITIACIESMCEMMLSGRIPQDTTRLKEYIRPGNYRGVRVAAMQGLVKLSVGKEPLGEILKLIVDEPVASVKREILKCIGEQHKRRSSSYLRDTNDDNISVATTVWNMLWNDCKQDPRVQKEAYVLFRNVWRRDVAPTINKEYAKTQRKAVKDLMKRYDAKYVEARNASGNSNAPQQTPAPSYNNAPLSVKVKVQNPSRKSTPNSRRSKTPPSSSRKRPAPSPPPQFERTVSTASLKVKIKPLAKASDTMSEQSDHSRRSKRSRQAHMPLPMDVPATMSPSALSNAPSIMSPEDNMPMSPLMPASNEPSPAIHSQPPQQPQSKFKIKLKLGGGGN